VLGKGKRLISKISFHIAISGPSAAQITIVDFSLMWPKEVPLRHARKGSNALLKSQIRGTDPLIGEVLGLIGGYWPELAVLFRCTDRFRQRKIEMESVILVKRYERGHVRRIKHRSWVIDHQEVHRTRRKHFKMRIWDTSSHLVMRCVALFILSAIGLKADNISPIPALVMANSAPWT
jgi:hypothetical protein